MTDTQTAEATKLVLRRTYHVPRERLFEAWTTPNILTQFLGPGEVKCAEVNVDLRVGGAYRIVMLMPDGERMVATGRYREIDRPSRVACTWKWEEDNPAEEKETLLTLEFLDLGAETELVLTHEALRDADSRDRHTQGWTQILDQLETIAR
jgi:uncharacterized protein YndB with AHSA1/START domain